jgi:DNA repair exonuclease SbcCD nuclease subunit
MRFIHAADIHLDSPLVGLERYEGAPVEQIRGATRQALVQLVDLSLAENVSFVLIAGDLYDGDWRDYNTGLFFVKEMVRLQDAGIRVFVVSGNHDAQNHMTRSLPLPGNVTVFATGGPESVELPAIGVVVHGQSFVTAAVQQNLVPGFPEPIPGALNIGLLHTNVDGQIGHDNYAPCTLTELCSKGYDYWALGHVHTGAVLAENPWVVYPGNIQGRHIRELGPKGCRLVEVVEGRVTQCEHRDLDVLRWQTCVVDISASTSVDDAIGTMVRQVEQLLSDTGDRILAVRLEAHGRTSVHEELVRSPDRWQAETRARIVAACSAKAWVERIRFRTRPPADTVAVAEGDHALGSLLAAIRTLGDDESSMGQLAELFAELDGRLPPELKNGPDGLRITEAETIHAALPDVRDMLLSRILKGGTE